jgi:hypothetical protein
VPDPNILQHLAVQRAVASLDTRAERTADDQGLVASYVDPGVGAQIETNHNQVLYGRRGTGKTHVLRVLQVHASDRTQQCAVFLDMRILGSSTSISTSIEPDAVRATGLLKDILKGVHAQLLKYVVASPIPDPIEVEASDSPILALNRLLEVITSSILKNEQRTLQSERATEATDSSKVTAKLSPHPELGGELGSGSTRSTRTREGIEGEMLQSIDFADLNACFDDVLAQAHISRVFVLLDEWASVPYELQPLLAEFIRRSFFALPSFTIKIAAVEHDSNFSGDSSGTMVGLDLGSDMAPSLDLDDYFLFDREPERSQRLFKDLLYRHMSVEMGWESFRNAVAAVERPDDAAGSASSTLFSRLIRAMKRWSDEADPNAERSPEGGDAGPMESLAVESLTMLMNGLPLLGSHYMNWYGQGLLQRELGVANSEQLVRMMFSGTGRQTGSRRQSPGARNAFMELCRAAEGVPRDFLQIFKKAFFAAQARDLSRINDRAIVEAASEWYQIEKLNLVQGDSVDVLARIVDDVVGKKRSRQFTVPKKLERNEQLQRLVNLRVVHRIKRGYVNPATPGVPYTIYAVDYGAYARFIGTEYETTEIEAGEEGEEAAGRVPIANATTLNGIVLTEEHLRCSGEGET